MVGLQDIPGVNARKGHRTSMPGRGGRTLSREQSGQSLTEYVLLLILVILASIVAWTMFGSRLSARVSSTGDVLERVGRIERQAEEPAASAEPSKDRRPDR